MGLLFLVVLSVVPTGDRLRNEGWKGGREGGREGGRARRASLAKFLSGFRFSLCVCCAFPPRQKRFVEAVVDDLVGRE